MFFFDDFETLSFSDFHQIGSPFVSPAIFFPAAGLGPNRGHQVAGMSSLKAFRIVRITRVLKVANSDGFWVVTAEGGGFMGGFSICFFGRINSFQCEFFRFFRNRFCL